MKDEYFLCDKMLAKIGICFMVSSTDYMNTLIIKYR